ncbi:hypothetical protein ACFYU5_22125 [Nocardia aobensis]|uniref:Uncharacterized protein n=1 Tax=Nocardia aobensis TaxID=257277 RepID=A0ABW6P7K2_9NOCA
MTDMIESSADMPVSQAVAVQSEIRPKAVGLVRTELSRIDTAAHALDIQCYAERLGYEWTFAIRPPQGTRDPVGYTLGIAAGMEAAAIIVVDMTHVDHRTDIGTAGFDLLTMTPPRLWRADALEPVAVQPVPLNDCTWEPTQLERDCARRLWNTHRDCLPGCRARLAAGAALSARDEVD